jgi:hypothetical protein
MLGALKTGGALLAHRLFLHFFDGGLLADQGGVNSLGGLPEI